MEAPAILFRALADRALRQILGEMEEGLMREILLNGSIVLLVGSFLIGWITGAERVWP